MTVRLIVAAADYVFRFMLLSFVTFRLYYYYFFLSLSSHQINVAFDVTTGPIRLKFGTNVGTLSCRTILFFDSAKKSLPQNSDRWLLFAMWRHERILQIDSAAVQHPTVRRAISGRDGHIFVEPSGLCCVYLPFLPFGGHSTIRHTT
jgi:hypothetical protein